MIAYAVDGREGVACPACRGRGDQPVTPKEQAKRRWLLRNEGIASAVQPAPPFRYQQEETG